jgi:hypothetical protein
VFASNDNRLLAVGTLQAQDPPVLDTAPADRNYDGKYPETEKER